MASICSRAQLMYNLSDKYMLFKFLNLVLTVFISTVKFDFDIVSRGNVSEVSLDSLTSASYFWKLLYFFFNFTFI